MIKITNRKYFGKLLKELNLNGLGVEIGVLNGDYSETILKNFGLKHLTLVDPWKYYTKGYKDSSNVEQEKQDAIYANVLKKMSKYENKVNILRMESAEAYVYFNDNTFDFIYIDANHSYEFVKEDIKNWFPKAKKGSVLAGHDYNENNRYGTAGVKHAVDEFCDKYNYNLFLTGERTKSWWIIK